MTDINDKKDVNEVVDKKTKEDKVKNWTNLGIHFDIQLDEKDIWMFSMYHANKGLMGLFNLLFTIVCLYYIVAQFNTISVFKKLLLIMCALMFSVIQPGLLYLKAKKQSKNEYIRNQVHIDILKEGVVVEQNNIKGEFEYEQVYKTALSKNMIIIYITKARAYLIPKRYYEDNYEQLKKVLSENTHIERTISIF